MKEENVSQLGYYDAHSVYNNSRMGVVISLCSNSNHLIRLSPSELPQILDIYSVVAQKEHMRRDVLLEGGNSSFTTS